VVVPAVLLLACVEADAAAIHRHHDAEASVMHAAGIPAAEVPVFKEWSRYLLAGPTAWARVEHPSWDQTVQKAVWESIRSDPSPTDPMVNFLLWKQALDPPRFNHYHPTLAPALHHIRKMRSLSSTPVSHVGPTTTSSGSAPGTGTSTTPATPGTSPTTSQDNLIPPPTVPEPGMLLLAAGMTAWFVRRVRTLACVAGE
jgi:hypothetical protein